MNSLRNIFTSKMIQNHGLLFAIIASMIIVFGMEDSVLKSLLGIVILLGIVVKVVLSFILNKNILSRETIEQSYDVINSLKSEFKITRQRLYSTFSFIVFGVGIVVLNGIEYSSGILFSIIGVVIATSVSSDNFGKITIYGWIIKVGGCILTIIGLKLIPNTSISTIILFLLVIRMDNLIDKLHRITGSNTIDSVCLNDKESKTESRNNDYSE